MSKILRKPPPRCKIYTDHQGRVRQYHRITGTPLPGLPWSPQFMAAWEAAEKRAAAPIGSERTITGTFNALIASYYQTPDFTGLRDSTKRTYRNMLERIRTEHGHRVVKEMQPLHIQKILKGKASTPAAANKTLAMLRLLLRHSMELGWRTDNPAVGARKIRHRSGGFTTWEESHIAAYMAHHKPGTRAHLAMMLLLHTGQRRGDVVRMGFHDLHESTLTVRQSKTGSLLHLPVHPDLAEVLNTLSREAPTFLTTSYGTPLTVESFGNWFRRMVREAGLPDNLSAHGLRKAACRRLAEAGCTPHEIMAISGHASLSEVTRYTVAAGKDKLALRAMAALQSKPELSNA